MRWIGIDEAGYGPNLGPMVMSAVVAGTETDRRPDLWLDPPALLSRAGGDTGRLWLDDSKRLYRAGRGQDRLEAVTTGVLLAAGMLSSMPAPIAEVIDRLCRCSLDDAELTRWLDGAEGEDLPSPDWSTRVEAWLACRPFEGPSWRILDLRSIVVGPEQFNAGLATIGNKAAVHASAFSRLLRWAWDLPDHGEPTHIRGDKHGGRNFYADMLARSVPEADVWIVAESPQRSEYVLTGGGKRFVVELRPRADADDGLVALASILSKTLRERWMSVFNGYWRRQIPTLRPTAGYPMDARRFRDDLERESREPLPASRLWWRER